MTSLLERTGREPVAGATNGLDQPVVTEFLQRLAQATDVHVDGALLDVDVAAPDAIQQLLARVHAFGVRHEEGEHAVLGWTERDGAFSSRAPILRCLFVRSPRPATLGATPHLYASAVRAPRAPHSSTRRHRP